MDKKNQIWNRCKDIKALKLECLDILGEFYILLGHKPEALIIKKLNEQFVEDLVSKYSSLTLDQVRFAIKKGLQENDPPIFVNVPTWNKFLRDFKKHEQLRRQNNQIESFQQHQKRLDDMSKLIGPREVKKIANGYNK